MRPNKAVVAGIFVHTLAMFESHNFTMQWITTPALAGDAKYDSDGDFRSDGTLSLYVIDCKTVAVP